MKETKKGKRDLGGGEKGRVEGRKRKKKSPTFISKQVLKKQNRTIHDLNWKTYKDINKTAAMSDQRHRK